MDIEIATNNELILELMKRKTFVGVVVSSKDNHKSENQVHNEFEIHTTTDLKTTSVLLQKAIYNIKK